MPDALSVGEGPAKAADFATKSTADCPTAGIMGANADQWVSGNLPHVAALYVQTNGAYFGIPGVDPWDEARDARTYPGPNPVVAHPPCQRWGKFWAGQPLHIKKTGERKILGDDNGCFAAALASVRQWGGILEHPEGSKAWAHFGLRKPPREGGWIAAGDGLGWTCCVEQGRYGHYARKPTWLLVYGLECRQLPDLDWGKSAASFPDWAIEKHGLEYCKRAGELAFKGGGVNSTARIHTPGAFRELLLSIARMVPTDEPMGRNKNQWVGKDLPHGRMR